MRLTEIQILIIENRLAQAGLNKISLYEEMLDHICCLVEHYLEQGSTFPTALELAFEKLSPDDIDKCQRETHLLINRNNIMMKRLSLATCGIAASCLLITTILTAQNFPSAKPLNNLSITSTFGERVHPVSGELKHHNGIDLKAPKGTPVMATADGLVIQVTESPYGHGKFVVISHADNYRTKYAQLAEFKVTQGMEVKKGQVVGLVGSSGESTAPHLHYEVIKDDQPVDPIPLIKDS